MIIEAELEITDQTVEDRLETVQIASDGGYDRGYAEGVQAEYDRFWDVYQQNGERTNYENAFYGVGWTDETYKPKYIPKPTGAPTRMFENTRVTKIDMTNLDATGMSTGGTSGFSSNYIKYLEMDIPNCTSLASSLYYMRGLKTLKLHNMNRCLLGALIHAFLLEDVEFTGTFGGQYFEAVSSNLLTYESLQNIIAAAYDYGTNPDGQAHRIGLHKDAKAKLTEADIAKLTQKGWTLT